MLGFDERRTATNNSKICRMALIRLRSALATLALLSVFVISIAFLSKSRLIEKSAAAGYFDAKRETAAIRYDMSDPISVKSLLEDCEALARAGFSPKDRSKKEINYGPALVFMLDGLVNIEAIQNIPIVSDKEVFAIIDLNLNDEQIKAAKTPMAACGAQPAIRIVLKGELSAVEAAGIINDSRIEAAGRLGAPIKAFVIDCDGLCVLSEVLQSKLFEGCSFFAGSSVMPEAYESFYGFELIRMIDRSSSEASALLDTTQKAADRN